MLYQLCLPAWETDSTSVIVGAMGVSSGEMVWVGRLLMNIAFVDDKTVLGIESPVAGVIKEIVVAPHDEVMPGQLVMTIEI